MLASEPSYAHVQEKIVHTFSTRTSNGISNFLGGKSIIFTIEKHEVLLVKIKAHRMPQQNRFM